MEVIAGRVYQEEIMKVCHEGMDSFQESRVIVGHFGMDKRGGHGNDKVVFSKHFQMSYRNYKYSDACQHVDTTKLERVSKL